MLNPISIAVLLSQRGKVGAPLVDYTLVDNSAGLGPQISQWNVATLGALPTQAELDAITPAQIAAFQATQRTAQFNLTSRGKDILSMIALIKRAQGIPAWNALTTPQKVAAALGEADVWTTLRDFLEANA